MKKPTAEMMQLQTEQIGLVSAAERFEATKAEVASSISQLTVKCSKMDQAMPELRDKLEHVVNMITVRAPASTCLLTAETPLLHLHTTPSSFYACLHVP